MIECIQRGNSDFVNTVTVYQGHADEHALESVQTSFFHMVLLCKFYLKKLKTTITAINHNNKVCHGQGLMSTTLELQWTPGEMRDPDRRTNISITLETHPRKPEPVICTSEASSQYIMMGANMFVIERVMVLILISN